MDLLLDLVGEIPCVTVQGFLDVLHRGNSIWSSSDEPYETRVANP